ncbi:hypothetical protein FOL47_008345 [Perkinsus chesapeaki]|uniref:Uncharacterized protein n=1 Tax=Perkinsus chesapeaki TaxID=330153 RepID=A0A7J6MU30_PERCH|nr:hypothetical protein FOL47_008345 [Perkinsus chesapeaki]
MAVLYTTLTITLSLSSTWAIVAPQPALTTKVIPQNVTTSLIQALENAESNLNDIENDKRWSSCQANQKDWDCQKVRWDALKVLEKDQVEVAILIQKAFDINLAVTKGINGRQKDIDELKDALNGPDGLVQRAKTIADGILHTKSTIHDQAEAISTQVKNLADQLKVEVTMIQEHVETKLHNLNAASAKLMNDQMGLEMKALQTSAETVNAEEASIAQQATQNANQTNAEIEQTRGEVSEFSASVRDEFDQLAQSLDEEEDTIKAEDQESKQKDREMKSAWKAELQTSVNEGFKKAQHSLDGAQKQLDEKLSSMTKELEHHREQSVAATENEQKATNEELKNDLKSINSKIERLAEQSMGDVSALEKKNNATLESIKSTQERTLKDVQRTTDDNAAGVNALDEEARVVRAESEAELDEARNSNTQGFRELQNSAASAQRALTKDASAQFEKANQEIAAQGAEAKQKGMQDSKELESEINSLKVYTAKGGKKNAEGLGDAISEVDHMKKLLTGMIKSGGDSNDQRRQMVEAMFDGELKDTEETSREMSRSAAARDHALSRSLSKEMGTANKELHDEMRRTRDEQEGAVGKLQQRQITNSQKSQGDMRRLGFAVEEIEGGVEEQKDAGDQLAQWINKVEASAEDSMKQLGTQIDSSKALEKSEIDNVRDKMAADYASLTDGEKAAIDSRKQKILSAFTGDLSDAQAKTHDTMNRLQSDADRQKQLLANDRLDVDKLLKETQELSATGNAEFEQLEAALSQKTDDANIERQQKLAGVKDNVNKELNELEGRLSGVIKQESSAIEKRGEEQFSQQKTTLDKLANELHQQSAESEKVQNLAKKEAETFTADSNRFKERMDTAKSTLTDESKKQFEELRKLKNGVETWYNKAGEDLSKSQQVLHKGMTEIPKATAKKQNQMKEEMNRVERSTQGTVTQFAGNLNELRSSMNKRRDEHNARRLKAVSGIHEGMVMSETGLLENLVASQLTSADGTKRMSAMLAALANSVGAIKSEGGSELHNIMNEVLQLGTNTGGLYRNLQTGLSKGMADLDHERMVDAMQSEDAIRGYALMDGRRLSGIGNQISSMLSDFHKDSSAANLALAGDKKDVYSLSNLVQGMGADSKLKLNDALHRIESGETTMLQEINNNVGVDLKKITAVKDLVQALLRPIESFRARARLGFDEIHSKIESISASLNGQLRRADVKMVLMSHQAKQALEKAQRKQEVLEKTMEDTGKKLKRELHNIQEEHTEMRKRQEDEFYELKNEVVEKTHEMLDKQRNMTAEISEMQKKEDSFMEAKLREVTNIMRNGKPANHTLKGLGVSIKDVAESPDAADSGWWASFLSRGSPIKHNDKAHLVNARKHDFSV